MIGLVIEGFGNIVLAFTHFVAWVPRIRSVVLLDPMPWSLCVMLAPDVNIAAVPIAEARDGADGPALIGAAALNRSITSLLYGVRPADPATLLAV